jgi:hypothetical protein
VFRAGEFISERDNWFLASHAENARSILVARSILRLTHASHNLTNSRAARSHCFEPQLFHQRGANKRLVENL